MEEKSILIRFRTEFKKSILTGLKTVLSQIGRELQGVAGKAGGVGRAFANVGKSVLGALNPLRLWNSIFGRVTMGMLTWQAWRTVVKGFRALGEAVVGTNAMIQTAQASFTTLTGSSEKASRLIDIVRKTAMETGVAFSDLVFESRRLTTQLGQNEVSFQKVTRAAVALSVLDPVQGISGAMFALSGFLEGTAQGARSLAQRFELPFSVLKQALEETATPIEALELAFERLGIDVDDLIARGRYTLPVITSNLKEMLRTFLQMAGQPLITRLTQDLARLRDWIETNRAAILGLAQAIGAMLERLYLYARVLLEKIFPALGAVFSINLPEFKDRAAQVGQAIGEGAAEAAAEVAQQAAAQAAITALEATEQAQKEAIRRLQNWVSEAAKVVQDKRDELRLFDLMTGDIPERFTRGRKRQLELELLAAEQEQRRRKEALDLAQQQLQAIQEQIAAQRELVQALETVSDAMEEVGGADLGFGEIDLSESESAIAQWSAVWTEQLSGVELKIRNFITAVAQLARGLLGQEPLVEAAFPGQTVPFENMFTAGSNIRQGIQAIANAIGQIGDAVGSISSAWTGLDPNLRKFLALIAAGGAAAIIAGGLTIPVSVLLLEIWLGREELSRWISGQRPRELFVVLKFIATENIKNQINELFSGTPITPFPGVGEEAEAAGVGGILNLLNALRQTQPLNLATTVAQEIGNLIGEKIGEAIFGSKDKVEESTAQGVESPILEVFRRIADAVVGRSIVPDMLRDIVREFQQLPGRLAPPLQALMTLLTTVMETIKQRWSSDWAEMVQIAQISLSQINTLQDQMATANANLQTAVAQAAASPPSVQVSNGPSDRSIPITLELDAQETQRLWMEGIYQGILSLPAPT